jgi:hypothetical protein
VDEFGGWAMVSVCYLHGDRQVGAAWHLPSKTTSLGGMVQWGLNDGRGIMDVRKVVAPSNINGSLVRSMP